MKNPSYHNFAQVPAVQIPRSTFDMSSRYKTAFDSGKVVPCMSPIEILPGDSIDLSLQAFARLTTPIVPFMDSLVMDFQFFFVPNRLVWSNFQKFMGEQENPDDSIDYQIPVIESPASTGFAVGSLADYFGIPTGVPGLEVNALPFRAYNLIWNEWYRPELLADSATVSKDDGPDDPADYALLSRFNRLDYFQGASPSPQKGDPVTVPIGGTAPVTGELLATNGRWQLYSDSYSLKGTTYGYSSPKLGDITSGSSGQLQLSDYTNAAPLISLQGSVTSGNSVRIQNVAGLSADLSAATTYTINTLRQAFQVQLFLERSELAGNGRYTEIIRSMFGVVSPDARLQRPEYLGGGSIPIVVSTVPQTSATDATSPQGNLAAFGLCKGHLPRIKKSFVEHGYLFAFVSVRSPVTYQQGLDRMWSRRTRFDFYWPVFAHLGEQAILNKEIYAQGESVVDEDGNIVDDKVFGYQERYAEYRYGISKVTGKLRSTASGTLDYWHFGVKYASLPELGEDFAKVNVPLSRVLAVSGEPQFVYDSFINCRMMRPMPLYGVPGKIDHYF